MEACVTYLKTSAYSSPALAIYNSGASVYRSLGKTNVTMNISVLSNIINVVGNVIGVFVLHAALAGDVKFTMYVSVLSTISGRLFLSCLLGIVLNMGVIGIAAAMVSDWVIRAVIFI